MLIYEMVAGYPPFYSENKVDMFKAICDLKFSFPPHFSRVRAGLLPGCTAPSMLEALRRTSLG